MREGMHPIELAAGELASDRFAKGIPGRPGRVIGEAAILIRAAKRRTFPSKLDWYMPAVPISRALSMTRSPSALATPL